MVRSGPVTAPAIAGFERAGGVVDDDRADLDAADQDIARRVALRLVRFDERGAMPRRQPVAALRAHEDPARLAAVLRQLREAGRIQVVDDGADEPSVELATEVSPEAWPALAAWLVTHGRAERLRRELESDAAQWIARPGPRDAGLLDRGQLSELATWLTASVERDLGLSDAARSFIAASQAAARRTWWPGRGAAGGVLAILLILGFLATPIILLLLVVLAASLIHHFG